MMKTEDGTGLTKWIIGTIFILILLILGMLQSCTTERKAVNFFNKHPEVSSKYCNEKFPIVENTVTNTVYVKADNKDYKPQLDSVAKEKDSLRTEIAKLKELADNDKSGNCDQYKDGINRLLTKYNALSDKFNKLNAEYKKCQSDSVNTTIDRTKKSTSELTSLKLELDDVNGKLKDTKEDLVETTKSRNKYRLYFFILIGLLGLYTVLKIKKWIPF